MTKNSILVDANFLYALSDIGDKYHSDAVNFARNNKQKQVVPDVVLTEVTYLLNKHVGHHAVLRFLKLFVISNIEMESLTKSDIQRAYEIMEKYSSARLDFVDCCIVALAERLNITQICTFDRRDFSIIRPAHCDTLELLP